MTIAAEVRTARIRVPARARNGWRKALAFATVVLLCELLGREMVAWLDLAPHLPDRPHDGADAYPLLVAAAKLAAAGSLGRIAWRLAHARRLERAVERFGTRVGNPRPGVRAALSGRLALWIFGATTVLYVLPTSRAQIEGDCWPLMSPWLHTAALPVFALLAVGAAFVWRTASTWLAEYEEYVSALREPRSIDRQPTSSRRRRSVARCPYRLFGRAFACRPPPALA